MDSRYTIALEVEDTDGDTSIRCRVEVTSWAHAKGHAVEIMHELRESVIPRTTVVTMESMERTDG